MRVSPIRTARLELIAFDPRAVRALIEGDRASAERIVGMKLPQEFPSPGDVEGFLAVQLRRMETSPRRRAWMARLMSSREGGEAIAIGHCGFHGPPEIIGRAEIGYSVFSKFRGKGYAKEAAGALVRWAFTHGERQVYASVSPDNAPSLAVVRSLGFRQVGTQEDEVDGLELVFVVESPSP
ncbi:MAG TPA: GNAT family N-acetyltransferase [Candidatus Dormibacteraeota bacterium]|nr:GNAT family N-acetyltransferase [Candidatus Dormibacteraeota bacterium]